MALVVGGRLFNLLPSSAAVLAPLLSPVAEDSLQPMSATYDGRTNQLGLFTAEAVKPCIQFDLNQIADSNGENQSVAAWLGSGGTISTDATVYYAGARSVKLTHTSAASRYQDILRRAGEPFALSMALRSDGTVTAAIYVRNLETGSWLASNGTWSSSSTAFASRIGSWTLTSPVTATVESQAACGSDIARLRVTFSLSASGSVWFDDLAYVPGYNLAAAAGHCMPASSAYTFRCATFAATPAGADPTATTTASCAPIRPTCYVSFPATRYERWVRFYLGYCSDATPMPTGAGELVLAYASELGQGHNWSFGWNRSDATRVVIEGPDGHRYPQVRGSGQHRELVAKYEPQSQTDFDAIVLELFNRCRAEGYPILWVPTDFDTSGTAILGHLVGESLATVGPFKNVWQFELRVREMPFASGFIP
jgi:hypothetical protein